MRIAISTDSGNVSPHFGRAPEFTFIMVKDNKVVEKKVFPNPGHTVGSIPKFINEQGANCIITGGMGPRAVGFFHQYGIEVIMGIDGSIDDVLEKLLNETLNSGESHYTPGKGKGYGVDKIHTEADDNKDHQHNHH